jgi:hypothetical protein
LSSCHPNRENAKVASSRQTSTSIGACGRNRETSPASSNTIIIARPPPRGVGTVCELRLFGMSSRSCAIAYRLTCEVSTQDRNILAKNTRKMSTTTSCWRMLPAGIVEPARDHITAGTSRQYYLCPVPLNREAPSPEFHEHVQH